MNKTESTKRVFPIRFHKLRIGSEYQIFAEPSRNIRKSNDTTIYVKVAESYSLAKNDPNKVAILMQEDLVIPLTRGQQA